jgi:2-polyprenyl-6-methoxyphenol hydroxylase-like FAD-dependent oxidoreductase
VAHLLFDEKTETVCGVQFRGRNHKPPEENPIQSLSADLVIDASGSSSRTPLWLKDLGYDSPKETEVNTQVGYATRYYQLRGQTSWNLMVIQSEGRGSRGGILMKIEGDRWVVVLTGSQNDYPPTNDAGYLEFARSLSDKTLYEAIKDATPISKIYSYRQTDNHIWHFEKLRRFPEHFLVMGDAACYFNPVYGQGMTVAALEAQALDHALRTWKGEKGFSHAFQRKLARVFASAWQLAISADAPLPNQAKGRSVQRISHWYTERIISLLPHDPNVLLTFLQVIHMLRPPLALMHPKILLKVITTKQEDMGETGISSYHANRPGS